MFSQKMYELGSKRSVIRELFEYGKKRAAKIGVENIFDFSLGNPSIPAPACVNDTIRDLMDNFDPVLLHGYTSAQGDMNVRKKIAEYINGKHNTSISYDNIYMTSGAAASLTICLKALSLPGDEIITFAPYFPEYRVFTEAAGASFVVIPPHEEDFQMDFDLLLKAISPKTKAILINSPNNPSGVVYSEENIQRLCGIMNDKSAEYGHPIFLITDEPYRELVYDNIYVPYLLNYYKNTFVCYSYSKSLSLPGERIGYIIVSNEMDDSRNMYLTICGAGRALGYVCASSMYQQVIARCVDKTSDISEYKKNRDLLYSGLVGMGYECVHPDGAFYLFVKSCEPDANKFCETAKKYELLIVPGDDFGCSGYVRIAYCVSENLIRRSMPAFEKLIKEYIIK